MFLLTRVESVILDPSSKTPVVVLRETSGDRALPIWVGQFEATSVVFALEGKGAARPITHDLFSAVLGAFDIDVEKLEIEKIVDGIFYANLYLHNESGTRVTVDCRPSDGVALALRAGAPIYVAEEVMDAAALASPSKGEGAESDEEHWKRVLESMDPAEFGKYKM